MLNPSPVEAWRVAASAIVAATKRYMFKSGFMCCWVDGAISCHLTEPEATHKPQVRQISGSTPRRNVWRLKSLLCWVDQLKEVPLSSSVSISCLLCRLKTTIIPDTDPI